ncbi:glycerophosphodiester phosphodiesterase [uncultured Microbulbifer sp.]|uniref:glycerophosphodiester phosphodiesterase n=1 Tax=uncultured Microbulbifer sp. TaxID=348147 RepID=UPI002638BAE9|nr:glycerophosphodiester phosphodiesterase [uncultured Microbulbifer sp.]
MNKPDRWLQPGRARPLVISHGDERGQGLYPGNTMLYLRKMVALGVDALEVDLNLTRDGHLVLLHDGSLERTTDGRGAVIDKTLQELKTLNAAHQWSADGEHYPYRTDPQSVVTIDEVFAEFPHTPMIIELKNNDSCAAHALATSIKSAGGGARVIVSSFHRGVIRVFRRLCPHVATGATLPEALLFFLAQCVFAEKWVKPAYQTMQLPARYYGLPVFTQRFVNAARRRDLHISVWTVDDEAAMKKYIALGLDGIVTNRPDRLLSIIDR